MRANDLPVSGGGPHHEESRRRWSVPVDIRERRAFSARRRWMRSSDRSCDWTSQATPIPPFRGRSARSMTPRAIGTGNSGVATHLGPSCRTMASTIAACRWSRRRGAAVGNSRRLRSAPSDADTAVSTSRLATTRPRSIRDRCAGSIPADAASARCETPPSSRSSRTCRPTASSRRSRRRRSSRQPTGERCRGRPGWGMTRSQRFAAQRASTRGSPLRGRGPVVRESTQRLQGHACRPPAVR